LSCGGRTFGSLGKSRRRHPPASPETFLSDPLTDYTPSCNPYILPQLILEELDDVIDNTAELEASWAFGSQPRLVHDVVEYARDIVIGLFINRYEFGLAI
jgi:hypothetical protein